MTAPSSTSRPFTASRLVALALIGLVGLGLAYLRFGPQDPVASVPTGAQAGDLVLKPCEFQAESGSYAADCGTFVVAEDPADSTSPLIALPVIRVRATSDDAREPVFFLTGGPGQSNIEGASPYADRYVTHRDFVMVGYRGLDGSVRLDCPEVNSAVGRTTDMLSEDAFGAYAHAYRSCANRLENEGIDPTRYGMVQQVDDMDAARQAFGYNRINLLSESAGTRTALIYGWRYPESIHRSVMVGVNPPGGFLWDPDMTDEQISRFAALCADDSSCRTRTNDLAATIDRTATSVPDRWLFLPIKESNVRAIALFGMFETAATGLASAPGMIDAWLSASEGDTSGLWFSSILADMMFPDLVVRGEYAAAASLDFPAARDYFADGREDFTNLGRAAAASAWAGGRLAGSWPTAAGTSDYQQVRTSTVETLVVNGSLDVSTPPQLAARELMPYLPNGHEVVLPNFGHTVSFFNEQPAAGTHLVNTFFDSGDVDISLYEPQQIDFTPPSTLGGYAWIILAVLLGFTAISILSLALLARRVYARGRIERKTSAALRSLFPVVLGLGGWSIGILVVLTAMPGVRITDAPVVIVSVVVPICIGTYWAWLDRSRSGRTNEIGLAAAAIGALIGAWIGFLAAGGVLAPLTTIVGAIAGTNLVLLVLDITTTAQASGRQPAREPEGQRQATAPAGIARS